MCQFVAKKNLSKFKTTSEKTKLKNRARRRCFEKNEIIGCVKIVYIKKGWLGFVVAKNSWNSTIQFHGGKNQNKYAFKKSVPQNLKIRDHQNLKKRTILHEKIEYYIRSSVLGFILLFLTFSRVLKLKY